MSEDTIKTRAQPMAVAASTEKKTAKKAPPKKAPTSKSAAAKTMKESKDPAERSAAAKSLSESSGTAKKAPAKKASAKKAETGMTQADVGAKIAATSKSAKGKATGKKVMAEAEEREAKPAPELPTEPVAQQDNSQLGVTMQKSPDPAVRSAAGKKLGESGAAKPKKAPAKKAAPKK